MKKLCVSAQVWALALMVMGQLNAVANDEQAIKEAEYNMPPVVEDRLDYNHALQAMETAADPAAIEAFKKANPAKAWLFGEDRQRGVRKNIFPKHWLEGAKEQLGKFKGVAQPGEYYVFQVVVVNGAESVKLVNGENIKMPAEVECLSLLPPGVIKSASPVHSFNVDSGMLQALWFGIQVPLTAKGDINLKLEVMGQQFPVTIQVKGEPLADGGIHDGWRLSRLRWLNSDIARSDTEVTAPFKPIQVKKDSVVAGLEGTQGATLSILGRDLVIGKNGLPAAYFSYFSSNNMKILPEGKNAFVAPQDIALWIEGNSDPLQFESKSFSIVKETPVTVTWKAVSTAAGSLTLTVNGSIEFDGAVTIRADLSSSSDVGLKNVQLKTSLTPQASEYCMGIGRRGGYTPEKYEWKWDISKHQDALWIGGVNAGAGIRFKGSNFSRPLINAYYDFKQLVLPDSWGKGNVVIEKGEKNTTVTATTGAYALTGDKPLALHYDLYLTPFKPIEPNKHFAERYYHIGQHRGNPNWQDLKKNGVELVNLHHNTKPNPFINYPYADQVVPHLRKWIEEVHAQGLRGKLYYTTRELTQNIPEFFALNSMKGEVILPRRDGVGWPVTNRNGPHAELLRLIGTDFVPAWRENIRFPEYKGMLDLAVITTPDTRWNNFYLEGLNYLVRDFGIDGLYIDDTALDRKSMQRARRILDQDKGATGKGRRIDMHSWNHFNGLAKFANSGVCFMELYPYYDSVWHGEGFGYGNSPEFILVEMSGIPFGLMSEMLDHANNERGFVFGCTRRWPWSGDPRPVWHILDAFGMQDSTMHGWWDAACPVKSSDSNVRATAYLKKDQTLIALGNWTDKPCKITLTIDWKALGLNPETAKIQVPPSAGIQDEKWYAPTDEIDVPPNNGRFLIIK